MKTIFRLTVFLFIIITFLISYLTFVGFETQKFNSEIIKKVKKIKKYIENNTENVGKEFAEEARKIYYGEKKARPIRGEASQDETKRLEEEGVPFSRLPWAREDA